MMKNFYFNFFLCFLLATLYSNSLEAQTAPTFTSTQVTAVNGNEIYTYGITTADAENDVVTVTASLPSGWPTLTTTTQVTTLAGSTYGFADGTGAAAKFANPHGIAIDASGTVYVADDANQKIRKITSAGVVTTLAGSTYGFADGTGAAAQFAQPFDVDVDASGNVYVADIANHRIRKITPAGEVTTLAGSGTAGFANGTGAAAQFNYPSGVAVDASGNVYVGDKSNHRIRKVTSGGVVTTLAGSGVAGSLDGTGGGAQFNNPMGIAVDASGNVYVGDAFNHRIRKITPAGEVTTLAGSTQGFADGTGASAQFSSPDGVTLDALGNVYVADVGNTKIRKITPAGVVTTLAGSTSGYADGLGTSAQFNQPYGIAVDAAGIVYVGDRANYKIRKITPSGVLTADATGRVGDYAVDVSANDGNGGITHQIFTITVSTVLTTTGSWSDISKWSSASVPESTHHAVIPSGKSATVDITNGVVNNLTVSGTLAIDAGNALAVSGNLINTGTFTINSDASGNGSLILNGASTGNITYNRYVTGVDKWHLISAPVGAQDINALVVTNVAANAVAASAPKYGLAPYDNSIPGWAHYTTGTVGGAGNFTAGKGYEVLRTSDGTVAFTGTAPTDNVSIGITKPVAPGNAWNLIGNPFPSAVKGNSPADGTNNFISVNTAALEGAYQAIYVWDAASSSYLTVNHTYLSSTAFYVAPGQAFFVYSVAGGATVNFTEAMQTHQTGNIFKSGEIPTPSIKLIAERTEGTTSTNILYLESMSTGLDPGYDAGRFSGGNNSFAVYTHLAGDNTNPVDFDIQCLPANEWDHIIPVGLNAPKNTEVVFRAEVMSLPSAVPVYLEDKVTGTFTVLNEPGNFYTIKLSEQSQGTGRFFLHTQSSVTGIGPLTNEADFSVIPRPQYNSIRVIGRFESESQISVYDMAGRKLLSRKLNATEINDVEMDGIISGVYVVYISSSPTKSSGKKLNWIKN